MSETRFRSGMLQVRRRCVGDIFRGLHRRAQEQNHQRRKTAATSRCEVQTN